MVRDSATIKGIKFQQLSAAYIRSETGADRACPEKWDYFVHLWRSSEWTRIWMSVLLPLVYRYRLRMQNDITCRQIC